MVNLMPMSSAAFTAYREASARGYAEDNVASGRWPQEGALQRSYEDFDASLPQRLLTQDHYVCEIADDVAGTIVGVLWFAVVEKNGLKSAFVYDIEIQAEFRRKGLARAAFIALEARVKALGLSSISLHVFGHNPGAQALYNSLGYWITGINMRKNLDTA